jgi:hypothetical protein
MTPYFGGQQADPQGVTIKDDSTGFIGFGRNVVTATSIISETIWGMALPEIWCNSGGNPLYAFMANALMVSYRDESTYADSLGILGAGPLGGFTQSCVVQNADGYRYVVSPMVDGYTWQGFKVNGNLNITKNQPGMGLRQVLGNDPVNPTTDYFSLGQGTPQVWEPNNYAAGWRCASAHHEVEHHPAVDAGSAQHDRAHRLRAHGIHLGRERQPLVGHGPDQPVLDLRQHAAARHRPLARYRATDHHAVHRGHPAAEFSSALPVPRLARGFRLGCSSPVGL